MRGLLVTLSGALLCAPLWAASPDWASGAYVEVRSNHVYTCGCLYSGELVTNGREAVVAWHIEEGSLDGIPVRNVRAVAVLMGAMTLSLEDSPRKSVIYLDGFTGNAQRDAFRTWVTTENAGLLGDVIAVYEEPVTFEEADGVVTVTAGKDVRVELRETRLPEDAHLGSILWYDPFVPVEREKLSTVLVSEYQGSDFGMTWRNLEHRIAGFQGRFAPR